MNKAGTLIGLATAGGLAVYFLDPNRGRARRAKARDKAAHLANQTSKAAHRVSRDIANRSRGLVAEGRSSLSPSTASDEVLAERVRSKIGRLVSNPHSIEISAENGCVTLRGPVLQSELNELLLGVSAVRGVDKIDDELTAHSSAEDIPELRHMSRAMIKKSEAAAPSRSPVRRALMGALGGTLVYLSTKRSGLAARGVRLMGLGLLSRGIFDRPWSQMTGLRRALT